MSDLFDAYPYQDRYAVQRALPDLGRDSASVLAELGEMAQGPRGTRPVPGDGLPGTA